MKNLAICLIVGMFLVSLASASLNFTETSLKTNYGTNELISGKFTITFVNQTDSSFTSTFGGSKSLYELVNSSGYTANTDFECNPADCNQAYTARYGEAYKSISVTSNQKLYGFLVNGGGIEIRNLSFQISSDAGESCLNQLYLDLFDDGLPDFYNINATLSECGNRDYGCFDEYLVNGEGEIGTTPYCQKIVLPSAPAYKVGANIKNYTTGKAGILKMELYSENSPSNLLGRCNLPNLTSSAQDLDCVVNYTSTKQFNALVCLSTNTDLTKYKINVAGGTEKCGTIGNENTVYTSNYEIYALPLKYGTINKIFDSTLYGKLRSDSENGLLADVQNYLDNKYGGNCEDGCVIPFSLSGSSQTVNIGNLSIKYNTNGVRGLETSAIYELGTKSMSLSSLKPLTINFENLGIRTPSYGTTSKFILYFESKNLTGDMLNVVSGIGFDISPKYVYIGQPVLFSAILTDNNSAIKSSSWDFGDGTIGQSSNGKLMHTYLNDGKYTVNVQIVAIDGSNSTRNFKVSVGNLYDSTRLLIATDEGRISNLTSQISTYDSWIKEDIEKKANLTQMSTEVADVKRAFEGTDINNSENLKVLIGRLVKLDVPYSIIVTKKGTAIPLDVGTENMDLSYLKSISSNSNQLSDSDLKDKIEKWMSDNYDSTIDFEVISRFGDSSVTPLLTKFTINLNSKTSTPAYLIIDYPLDSIKFKTKGDEKAVSTGTFIPVNGVQNIQFMVPGSVKINEIGAYISPEISALGTSTGIGSAIISTFSWTKFLIGLLVLLILAAIVFYFGRRWYIYYYEGHLFKNPKDLYNLINFVISARNNKLNDSEIKRKLKAVGWNLEQIDYAMSKIKSKTSKVY